MPWPRRPGAGHAGGRRARAARASVAAGRRARPSDLSPRVGTISLVLLTETAETSDAVASTRARLAKVERLAACLRRLDPREVVVARKDQRRWGQTYLRGLLLDGKRKSIQPMAARLAKGDPQADAYALEQALQQFVNQSPWDPAAVRRRLAQRMTAAIGPQAWVIDDTGFPKYGPHSLGVARQYCGALGKVANCQVGVSVHAATEQASCPLDWRLFLPEEWDADAQRRRKAHVPDEVHHRPKWQLALDMLDELAAWELAAPALLADAAYGEAGQFRLGLEERELAFLVQVPATISAYPRTWRLSRCRMPAGAAHRLPATASRAVAARAGAGRG